MIPRHGWTRRTFLSTVAMGALSLPRLASAAALVSKTNRTRLGMPGPHPGRVVAVPHPACIVDGKFRRNAINEMIEEGMIELTGATDAPEAWRQFFEPGDIVGIKLTPVGGPLVMSSAEAVQGVI